VISSKLPHTGASIFSTMTALAIQEGAINLSQGFPDFQPDGRLQQAVARAISEGFNQYAPMIGIAELRTAISARYQHFHGLTVDPDTEVTITPGGTAALFTALAASVHPGDRVLIFDPAYDSYAPAVQTLGASVVRCTLTPPLYKPDMDFVRNEAEKGLSVIIVNSPHNPTGTMWTSDDIDALAIIADRYDILILSDEVYELITYDTAHSPLMSHDLLRHRTFTVTSFGKLIHATGWKVGACVASPALTNEFRKVHQYLAFSVHTPTQVGLAEYTSRPEVFSSLPGFFKARRSVFCDTLNNSQWGIRPCHGTYFQLLDFSRFWKGSDVDLAVLLTKKWKVASIPLSPFTDGKNGDTCLRFCFAKSEQTLSTASMRLADAASTL